MSFIIKIRILLWSILAILVAWLLFMAIVPTGKITYSWAAGERSYFIGKLTPAERVQEVKDGKLIIGDPVYFSLQTPRRFEKAKLTLKYKIVGTGQCPVPTECSSIIEAGILTDKKIWQYDLRPMENGVLDDLMKKWHMIREGEMVLLQKNKKYKTINDFLNNLPAADKIAVYNYDFRKEYLLKDYKASEEMATAKPLRGAYQFYTYLKNENLNYNFIFSDLNKNRDRDNFEIVIYYRDEPIEVRKIDDDGNVSDDGQESAENKVNFNLANLPEGVYKIEIKANDDIVTKQIKTTQSKLSFINKIWLSQGAGENITLYTDSREINTLTANPGRLQNVKVGDENLAVEETYKQFSIKTKEKISEIKLKKDDIILAGDGVFSFATSSLINPALKKVDENFSVDDTEFILVNYQVPKMENGWKITEAEFDLTSAYSEKNKFNFLISVPGLKADDNIQDGVIIKEIRMNLEGRNLWEFLKKFIK